MVQESQERERHKREKLEAEQHLSERRRKKRSKRQDTNNATGEPTVTEESIADDFKQIVEEELVLIEKDELQIAWQIGEQADKQLDEQTDKRLDEQIAKKLDELHGEPSDEQAGDPPLLIQKLKANFQKLTGFQTAKQIDEQTAEQIDEQISKQVDELVAQQLDEQTDKQLDEQIAKKLDELHGEPSDEQAGEPPLLVQILKANFQKLAIFYKKTQNNVHDKIKIKSSEIRKKYDDYDFDIDQFYAFFGVCFHKIHDPISNKLNQIYEKNPEKKKIREKKNRRFLTKLTLIRRRVIKREKKTAAKLVDFIDSVDKRNDDLADRTIEIVEGGTEKFNLAREWAEINKKKLLIHFTIFVLVVLGFVAILNNVTAYEYAYNGRVLGMVKNQEDVLKVVDLVSTQLSKEHNAEVSIDKEQDITFHRVITMNSDIDDMEDVLGRLTYMQNMNAKGYGIYVNEKRIAIVDSKKTANSILTHIKDLYLSADPNTEYEDVDFAETVEIKQIDTKLGRLQNPDAVISKIMTGATVQKVHVVVAGETFSGIAKQYNISMADLQATNPLVTPEKLSIGQEILLTQAAPLLVVQTVEVLTYTKEIPFETTYENNASYYIGEQRNKVSGVNGEEQVTSRIVRNNGQQVAELVLENVVLSEPITAVFYVGTKEPPPKQGTGSFIYPVSGYKMSSKFGSRWGRMHYGLDLACATGTRIVASDGGTVTFAGYSGSYGYVVKINHGSNFTTVYAHCSKLFVKKGEKVYQGQHIANVGNTGRSTGPHCHFEIQVSGVPKNPLNYL